MSFEALWSDNSQQYDEHLAKIYEENYQRQKAIQKQKIQQEFEEILGKIRILYNMSK